MAAQPLGSRLNRLGQMTELTNDRVLIVGIGGLGVPAAMALVRAGVFKLGLIDPDPIELSNLARQVIYRVSDLGAPKVIAAAQHLTESHPDLQIETYQYELNAANAAEAIRWLRGETPALAGSMLTYDGGGPGRIRLTPVAPRPGCGCGAADASMKKVISSASSTR